jgi:phosphoribosylformylglycinamidine synthase II
VIDLGDGIAVAFKAESHNHPSAVEPFQGAATGVGGILRDIVAMGARPIALLDSLRFGKPDWHFRRAVAGIGHYGNCVGVPNVGGECAFDEAYARNPLVNAMCVGILPTERVLSAKAQGVGNALVLYGALTGRDGIGGASVLASQDLEGSDEKRPSVQIGDPFRGKALIEVSLDLVEQGLVVSLQDCGAAGLASSLSEMARDGMGVDVHLDRVPLREDDMEPWEIMISESQERMVAVVAPERVDDVRAVCERWELPCTVIGEVTDHGDLRALSAGEVVGSIPADLLTDECPRYEVEQQERATVAAPVDPINDEPKTWVFEQYDHLVGSRTVRRPGLDAAVLRIDGTRGIAVSLDGPPLGCRNPLEAGWSAVMEAALNVACAGGEPLALTDCLNFGNPRSPRSAGSSGRRSKASRVRPSRSASPSSPATSRSTTRRAGRRSHRRPSSAASGSCGTSPASPTAGSAATASSCCAASGMGSSRSSGATPTCSRSRTTFPTAASRSRSARLRTGPACPPKRTSSRAVGSWPPLHPAPTFPGTTSSSSGRSPDVRRLRSPRARP